VTARRFNALKGRDRTDTRTPRRHREEKKENKPNETVYSTHLREDRHEAGLAQQRRLAAHVRARQQQQPARVGRRRARCRARRIRVRVGRRAAAADARCGRVRGRADCARGCAARAEIGVVRDEVTAAVRARDARVARAAQREERAWRKEDVSCRDLAEYAASIYAASESDMPRVTVKPRGARNEPSGASAGATSVGRT
jgi:hypothetical protein